MAKSKSPNMDKKAGSYGDRLKHALLLETLERTASWPRSVYAETHAGAGVYQAEDQSEVSYIRDLRQHVKDALVRTSGPGLAYLTWLREWWSDPKNGPLLRRASGSFQTAINKARKHVMNAVAAGQYTIQEKDERFLAEIVDPWLKANPG